MSRILNALQQVNTSLQLWGATKSVILMYHRIAASDFDPWRLSVSPQHFAEHLDIIRQQAIIVGKEARPENSSSHEIEPIQVFLSFD